MAAADRTKQALGQALKELMEEQPLEKISVGDVTSRAQVGRNTFYYHFKDKYDLVNWIFETECSGLIAGHGTSREMEEAMLTLDRYIRENLTFYRHALEYSGQNSLQDYIYNLMEKRVLELVREQAAVRRPDMSEDEILFISSFFASGLQGMLVRGIRLGHEEDGARFRQCVHRYARGNMLKKYLDELWRSPAE